MGEIERCGEGHLSSEEGQDAGAGADVNDNFVLEVLPVVHDRPVVRPSARHVLHRHAVTRAHAAPCDSMACGMRYSRIQHALQRNCRVGSWTA